MAHSSQDPRRDRPVLRMRHSEIDFSKRMGGELEDGDVDSRAFGYFFGGLGRLQDG